MSEKTQEVFWSIPGYSNYKISRNGDVINVTKGTTLSGSVNPAGYVNFRLRGDDGYTLTWGRHRLLCYVFKELPPDKALDDLIVNHINGMKGDDRLDNLEWVTYKGNIEHAGWNNLTSKCIPVSVKDVLTGEVTNYPSIIECARDFGYTKDQIKYRVMMGDSRVFPEMKQYRDARIERPWYRPDDIEYEVKRNGRSKSVLVRILLTGEVLEFSKLREAANYLKIPETSLSAWLRFNKQPVLPGFIQLKWLHDQTPWREPGDLHIELSKTTGLKPVKVINNLTGETTVFESVSACATTMGLLNTTLCNRLKSAGEKVYADNYRYAYYISK